MDESVFFNPGDAIANSFDYENARRSAEIYKRKNIGQTLLIARSAHDPSYAVFLETDRVPDVAASGPDVHVETYLVKESL